MKLLAKSQLFALFVFLFTNHASIANQYEVVGDVLQWALPLTALGLSYIENDVDGVFNLQNRSAPLRG